MAPPMQTMHSGNSLCGSERQLKVVPAFVGVEGGVLKGVREEAVH